MSGFNIDYIGIQFQEVDLNIKEISFKEKRDGFPIRKLELKPDLKIE